ncbi:MAG: hypothetical protein HXY25_09605 [Alphaproteobacteria bacterium]|nr:hypothetical protein [Alphaproteobacteria bacterium]
MLTRHATVSWPQMLAVAETAAAETSGESEECKVAVAHALRNRLKTQPSSLPAGRRSDVTWDAGLAPPDDPALASALAIVCRVWTGEIADPTHGATLYRPHSAPPPEVPAVKATALLGRYCFYRPTSTMGA